MAIWAHFQGPAVLAGKDRARRRTLQLEAHGALPSGTGTAVQVHNISASGLLLESEVALDVGEALLIDLPHVGSTAARVVWRSGGLSGCEFEIPLSRAALSAAELRSAIAGELADDQALPESAQRRGPRRSGGRRPPSHPRGDIRRGRRRERQRPGIRRRPHGHDQQRSRWRGVRMRHGGGHDPGQAADAFPGPPAHHGDVERGGAEGRTGDPLQRRGHGGQCVAGDQQHHESGHRAARGPGKSATEFHERNANAGMPNRQCPK